MMCVRETRDFWDLTLKREHCSRGEDDKNKTIKRRQKKTVAPRTELFQPRDPSEIPREDETENAAYSSSSDPWSLPSIARKEDS